MKKSILLFACLLLNICLYAQQRQTHEVAGTVVDELGDPIAGATVIVKDRIGGEITDGDGKFKIKAQQGDLLYITYMGFERFEHLVSKSETDLKITMIESKQLLDEVVVVGVGSKRKVSQVAALSTVNVADLQVPTSSVANLLGGRVAGLVSMMSSGEPGKNIADFWIRGIGTFGYNSGALVLIDGLEGDINSIDPADIESFSILKDASATAVYGVRGANGVVIITTKKGVSGKMNITGRINVSLSQVKRMPDYVGAYDYALLANEAKSVRGDLKLYNDIEMEIIQKGLDKDLYPNVNWQDELVSPISWRQQYYASARGGGEVSRYFISLSGSNETAAYKVDKSSPYASNVGYNTYNYRINLDLNLTPTTTAYVGSDGFLKVTDSPGVASTDYIWQAQAQVTPLSYPIKYSTGDFPSAGSNQSMSPYVMINQLGRYSNQEFQGKATLALNQDLAFVTEGLKFSIQGSYDITSYFREQRLVMPSLKRALRRTSAGELVLTETVQASAASYGQSTDQFRKYYMKSTLNYNRKFGYYHNLSVLINAEIEDRKLGGDAFDANQGLNANLRSIPKRYMGAAGWINYSFNDMYLIDFNLGYTGTENFQPGRQFGWFPAVGIGWVPTAYEWTQDNLEWLDFFKIRATIGSVGNDRISSRRFPYLTMVNQGTGNSFGLNGQVNIITDATIGADNLEWEQSVKSDLGLELRMLKERLSLTVDIYNDQRQGIFQERVQIPQYVGLTNNPYGNVGKMRTYGADGNASYIYDFNKNTGITIRGNFTYWNSEVQNWEQVYPKYSYQEYNGYPNGIVRGYRCLGFFKDEEDIIYSPIQSWNTVMPGDLKYMDVNGDGIINDDDKIPLSYNSTPRLQYGIGGEFKYKNLTAGVLFRGSGKTDYYIVEGASGEGIGYIPFRLGESGNVLTIAADPRNRWIPRDYALANGIDPSLAENPNAEFPRLQYGDNANNRQFSDFWKRDGQYFRLQEITLNYNMRNQILKKIGVSSVDLQLIGTNLYVWSKSKMFDPEQAKYNGLRYPIPATYAFQIYINL
jgi:TonB-linked SusC/RagA family outer membrane protein